MTEVFDDSFKSGFVGLVGPTNSGKSTLLNALVGEKVSIVSRRAQTTYHGVKGILNTKHAQIVFIDTPGFQRHPEPVARLLNRVADKSAKEADILVWVFDASNPTSLSHVTRLQPKITGFGGPEKNICVLNKVDKITKENLLPLMQQLFGMNLFSDIVPISAAKADGTRELTALLESKLNPGVPYFPRDMYTDRPQQFLVSEFIREKIYEATAQEIPYSVMVEIEGWEEVSEEKKIPTIRAIIHVDADSKKGILIGKSGEMLKRIGTAARQDAEKLVGHQICLKLHVDVEREWKKDSRVIGRYLELN